MRSEFSKIRSGRAEPTIVEYPVLVKKSQLVQWKREAYGLDQKELATLQSQGWTIKRKTEYLGVSQTTLKTYLYGLDRTGKRKRSIKTRYFNGAFDTIDKSVD